MLKTNLIRVGRRINENSVLSAYLPETNKIITPWNYS